MWGRARRQRFKLTRAKRFPARGRERHVWSVADRAEGQGAGSTVGVLGSLRVAIAVCATGAVGRGVAPSA